MLGKRLFGYLLVGFLFLLFGWKIERDHRTAQPRSIDAYTLAPSENQIENLKSAKRFIVYSIKPQRDETPSRGKPLFCGNLVVGQTEVQNDIDREILRTTLLQDFRSVTGATLFTFFPYHAVRAIGDSGTMDIVIAMRVHRIAIYDSEGITEIGRAHV